MRPWGRRWVALVGLSGTMALSLCVAAAGPADTLKTEVDLTTKDAGAKELVLGDLVADAVRAEVKSDAAFIAATSFTEDKTIPKGNTTTADILKTLDYKGEKITVVKLTGEKIKGALQHGLFLYPKTNSGFLQFSGLVVTINPDAEADKRVVSIKADGDALETSKTYKVAMPAPLAKGALAYFKIWDKKDIDKETDKTLEDALTNYLSEHKTITKGDERLVVKGK